MQTAAEGLGVVVVGPSRAENGFLFATPRPQVLGVNYISPQNFCFQNILHLIRFSKAKTNYLDMLDVHT